MCKRNGWTKKTRTNNNNRKWTKRRISELYIIKVYRSHLKTTPFSKWNYATIRTPCILIIAPLTQFSATAGHFISVFVFGFCLVSRLYQIDWCWFGGRRVNSMCIKIKEYAPIRCSISFGKNDAEASKSNKMKFTVWANRDRIIFQSIRTLSGDGKCRTQIQTQTEDIDLLCIDNDVGKWWWCWCRQSQRALRYRQPFENPLNQLRFHIISLTSNNSCEERENEMIRCVQRCVTNLP